MHEGVTIGVGCRIDPTAQIGHGTHIGDGVRINAGVVIGENCTIEDLTILGYGNATHLRHEVDPRVLIGNHVTIRPRCTVYLGCRIGDSSSLHHSVEIREETIIGHHTSIGSKVWCEGYTVIGNHVTVHAQCHLTACMVIEDYVFVGPMVTTANARMLTYKRQRLLAEKVEKGPTIGFGAIIGSQAMLLPGIVVGREAIIGAGANVTRDIPAFMVAKGNPARVDREVPSERRLQPGIDFPLNHPVLQRQGDE